MICSSLNRFFTSNLPPGLDSKPFRYSKAGGRRSYADWNTQVTCANQPL